MSDSPDSPPEREMKDFQFRQMKKFRVFDKPQDLPRYRSSLLAVSNKFGLTFVGLNKMLKVYWTLDILTVDILEGNPNFIMEGQKGVVELDVDISIHHVALSSDEFTLSVCGMTEEGLSLTFYDTRAFMNKANGNKLPFARMRPDVDAHVCVQDLKWNPVQPSVLALCLSDGSMSILDVTDGVSQPSSLPASNGITSVCWSPKGKQVAAGKMNATVIQYSPTLEEKKVIPCPNFYNSDNPVKVLDVLWLRTYVFAVAYAAADGSPETPPELVVISLPQKKDERTTERYLNFNDLVYGTCTERQHHYFLNQIEDWDVVFAASAASMEVSIIARQEDKTNWELWILEDAARAELPVSENNDDTLPLGVAIDYTSNLPIMISEEKSLPPSPVMLVLSTDGVLCPFSLVNFKPGVKQMVAAPVTMPLDGERMSREAPRPPAAPAKQPSLLAALGGSSATPPSFSFVSADPPVPPSSTSTPWFSAPSSENPPMTFSLPPSTAFSAASSAFSFAPPPSNKPQPAEASAADVAAPAPLARPAPPAAAARSATPECAAAAPPAAVKLNFLDKFSAGDVPGQTSSEAFSIRPPMPKLAFSEPSRVPSPAPSVNRPPAMTEPVRPLPSSTHAMVVQRPSPAPQSTAAPQAALSVKALEKQLQQKRDSDPILVATLEEIAHFQRELDDLKTRSTKADFRVGSTEEMRELRKESEDLHVFTLEIKETTESLHGDIGSLKTTLLEGFAGAEDAKSQNELGRDRSYLQLLYKKPLDPRSEEQLKEIRRLYQYAVTSVEDVNDVLDVEWEKHLEKRKKLKHMVVPGREALFTTLANNNYIINQQQGRLDQLIKELTSLRLYNKTSAWTTGVPAAPRPAAAEPPAGLDNELESLRDALLKAKLEVTPPPKTKTKSPVKITPAKQAQLRNLLSKGKMPPVHSTAPANLYRSAFLSPKYYEDLDDVSSTSSLSQSLDPRLELEDEEELEPEPLPLPVAAPPAAAPRHPTVVRTPSIQPGFGSMQSTPFTKVHPGLGRGLVMSPIPSPVPSNKINLGDADSTALATKTVKHGAPPSEKATPLNISAQQAAATAALRRQMANQKPGMGASLTESTLKTVPQVVNVQELKDKGPHIPVSTVLSSSVPAPAAQAIQQVFATVATNQAKRNPTQGMLKTSADGLSALQANYMFSGVPKADSPVVPELSSSKGFSFSSTSTSLSFTSVAQGAGSSQVKDVGKFSFGGSGKMMFGGAAMEEPFSLPSPRGTSPALGGASSPTPPPPPIMSGEPVRPSSATPALRVEPQAAPKAIVGGETLGSFSGLRVGQGDDEAKDAAGATAKPAAATPTAASFSFSNNGATGGLGGLGGKGGASQFSFAFGGAAALTKPAEAECAGGADAATKTTTLSVGSGGVFKPPESKLAFSLPAQSGSGTAAAPAATSFSSLLAAPLDAPPEEPKLPTPPPEPTPTTTPEPAPAALERISPPAAAAEPASSDPDSAVTPTVQAPTPPPPASTAPPPPYNAPPAPTVPAEPPVTPPAEAAAPPPETSAPPVPEEPTPESVPAPSASEAAAQPPPPPYHQAPSSDKPGSIFTQQPPPPHPAATNSSTVGAVPIIHTAAPASTTLTPTVAGGEANAVFGQPAPPGGGAPVATGFGSMGFGTPAAAGTGFCKPVFGQQGNGFGQPASTADPPASGFSFGQPAVAAAPSAFGASSASGATTGGGGSLFGAPPPTASNASSFSFGTSTASNTGAAPGLFGQTATPPAFGQQSAGFGQGGGSVFGSNTTTTSSTGFSFGQTSAFGTSNAPSGFGQQSGGGSVFGQQQQQQPSGGGLFGSGPANAAGPGPGGAGGFFSGLGGKPSEDAANKNPFGAAAASPGAFGQQAGQPGGATSLFGASSSAKGFGFGQTSFGEQKPGGTFTAGAGSVASQGFGSFTTPTKPSGFGSAPVFGTATGFGAQPAFGGAAAFGSPPSFSNPMGSPANKVFGEGTAAANMGGFGFASPQSAAPSFGSLATQSAPSFGALAQQGGGAGGSSFGALAQQGGGAGGSSFGALAQQGGGAGGSSFGALAQQGGAGGSTFGALAQQSGAGGFGQQQQQLQQQQQQQLQQQQLQQQQQQPSTFGGFGPPQPQVGAFPGNAFGSTNQSSSQSFSSGWRS